MIFEQKITATFVLSFSVAIMIFARRYRNKDEEAGVGLVVFAALMIFGIWVS